MLEDILNNKHISLYKLSKQSQIPYSTLIDLKSGKTKLDNITTGCLHALAKALNMTMDQAYEQLSAKSLRHIKTQEDYPISQRLSKKVESIIIRDEQHQVQGRFRVDDQYHVNICFKFQDKDCSIPFAGLVTNQRLSTLESLGYLAISDYIERNEFEELINMFE